MGACGAKRRRRRLGHWVVRVVQHHSRPQHWRATWGLVSNQHAGRQQCSSLFQSVPLRPWPLLVTPMPLLPLITLPLLLIIQLRPLITLLLLLITLLLLPITPLPLLLITQPLMLRRLPRTTNSVMMCMGMTNMATQMSTQEPRPGTDLL